MDKTKIFIIVSALIIIGLIIFLSQNNKTKTTTSSSDTLSSNVEIVNGQQIINLEVKGGYKPKTTVAQAGIPTIIRAKTNNTFDCSTALRIPDLKYSKNLPPNAATDIEVPSPKPNTSLKGLCSMGMYSFVINFRDF